MKHDWLDGSKRDPLMNQKLTAMLQALITANPIAGINAVDPSLFEPGIDERYVVQYTQRKPTYCIWASATDLLILFSGMQDLSQTIGMINGWTKPPSPPTINGVMPFWEQAWANILAENNLTIFTKPLRVYLVGHSFGGAVACAAGVWMMQNNVNSRLTLITYGSPRVGIFAGAQAVSNCQPTRWMLTDDPIPFCPPWRQESESLAAVLTNPLAQGMSEQCQSSGGWGLGVDGTISQNETRTRRVPRIWLSIGSYLSGSDSFFAPNHAIGVYNSSFAAAVAKAQVIPPNPPWFPPEPPPRQTPAEIRRTVHIGEAQIEADAQDPNGVTRNYAPPPVLDPSGPYYRAARDGNVWVVKLGTNIVAAATGKRSAKVLARRWNRASRAALRMEVLG